MVTYHTVCMYKHPVYSYCASCYSCNLLPLKWLPLSVATCCTVLIYHHMPYSCYLLPHAMQFVSVDAHHTVCYLLPHAVQMLFVALSHAVQLLFVVTCHAAHYLLLDTAPFAICCHMPYSLLFVAACHAVAGFYCIPYSC